MEDGLYHLGYKDAKGNFQLINKFTNIKLACAVAGKMMQERQKNQDKDSADGIPPA